MSARSVFPRRAVFQSATPADRTSRRSPSVVRARACVRARTQAWRKYAVGACVLVCERGAMRCKQEGKMAGREEGGNPEQEKGAARVLRGHRGWWDWRVRECIRKKAPCACCGAERTEGSGSGACGAACAATSSLRDGPVHQSAVGACASGCVGVGGGVRGRGVDADAAADGDVDEPPCTYLPQPDRVNHIHAAGVISTQRGTTRVRRRASASVTSVVDG